MILNKTDLECCYISSVGFQISGVDVTRDANYDRTSWGPAPAQQWADGKGAARGKTGECWCEVCGRTFTMQGQLNRHMRSHTGARPYACSTCGKAFHRKDVLYKHRQRHEGQGAYQCCTCGQAFVTQPELRNHSHSHMGCT